MENQSFRSTASFGKRIEFFVIGQLLKKQLDVYIPLVDDDGVDAIIKTPKGKYIEIQIKARSKYTVESGNCAVFAAIKHEKERENYYFIFYSEPLDTTWIMSSKEFLEHSTILKTGPNAGKRSIFLSSRRNGKPCIKKKFEKFVDQEKDFERLKNL